METDSGISSMYMYYLRTYIHFKEGTRCLQSCDSYIRFACINQVSLGVVRALYSVSVHTCADQLTVMSTVAYPVSLFVLNVLLMLLENYHRRVSPSVFHASTVKRAIGNL